MENMIDGLDWVRDIEPTQDEIWSNIVNNKPQHQFFNKEWSGDLNLNHRHSIKSLGRLEVITGDLTLNDSNLEDLGNLRVVKGSIRLHNNKLLNSLGKLEIVGGNLMMNGVLGHGDLFGSGVRKYYSNRIENLGNVREVGGMLDLYGFPIKELNNIKIGRLFIDCVDIQLQMNNVICNDYTVTYYDYRRYFHSFTEFNNYRLK